MIDWNPRVKLGWDSLLIVSLAVIAAATWFAFFAPAPKAVSGRKGSPTFESIVAQVKQTEQMRDVEAAKAASRTWRLSAEALGSTILEKLTELSAQHRLKITDFRGGRMLGAGSMRQASFMVGLEGAFPDVMAALDALESPGSKLAVTQLKVSSKGMQDVVSATISLTGFLAKEDI